MSDISSDIITSTGMMEQYPGLFGAEINGRFFRLEHITAENALILSMGATNLSEIQRTTLKSVWNAKVRLPQNGPVYSDHFVSFLISVESDWVKRLNSTIELLNQWADENEVKFGCFLCGSDDPSVYMREVSNQNTYICDNCENRLREEEATRIQEHELRDKSSLQYENFQRYLLRVIFFRALPSFLWIPLFGSLLAAILPLPNASEEKVLEMDATIAALVIFLITNFIFFIYFKSTDEKSVPGVIITSAVCFIATVIEGIMAFSISRVSLELAEGQDSATLIRVLTHLPDYFNGPITGMIGLYVFWFPLIGLVASILIALINANHDDVAGAM
jgi:hypothetical protein